MRNVMRQAQRIRVQVRTGKSKVRIDPSNRYLFIYFVVIFVCRIITESFYQKADLEQWLIPKLKPDCYTELLDAIWEPLVSKNLR